MDMTGIDETAIKLLFTGARAQNGWKSGPVTDAQLKAAYDIAKWGPTSLNTQPMRLVFLRSEEGKSRLKPALAPGNVEKTMTAPVVAIIAYDTNFHSHLPRLFPHNPNVKNAFAADETLIETTAFRNGTLQAAYFLLSLRAIGLDVAPMSGFDGAKVNEEFFRGTTFKVNFICGIGFGDPQKVFPRSPRFDFSEIAQIE
jgi:3-hydroxypropanoate dehydrogenase